MGYNINNNRQKMVDSWPLNLNCDKAINEWGWKPIYKLENAFSNYLIPNILVLRNITQAETKRLNFLIFTLLLVFL